MAEHPASHPVEEPKEAAAEEPEDTSPVGQAFKASGLPASDKKAFVAGYHAAGDPRPDLNR